MKKERIIGILLFVGILIGGALILTGDMLYMRLLLGLALGYTLTRASTGFAGSVNRAYNAGSTKLMRAMAVMFFVTAAAVGAILAFAPEGVTYDLWVNPINFGLILGGLLFGFGMSLSICCASGVLTDLVTGFPRAAVTLLFFMLGVFLGFPIQNKQDWVKQSWFSSAEGKNGVSFADWFPNTPFKGYLVALIITGLLVVVVIVLSKYYENKRKAEGTLRAIDSEVLSERANSLDTPEAKLYSGTFSSLILKPWTLLQGSIALSLIFVVMFVVTKAGWGASTPYGIWIGQLLSKFGVSQETLTNFSGHALDKSPFAAPFLGNGVTVQNIGIFFGTMIYLLWNNTFLKVFQSEWKIDLKSVLIFALGGFMMGFGTRLSNGCNVGALYTPIANFSLSGWIFMIVMIIGAVLGNMVFRRRPKGNR